MADNPYSKYKKRLAAQLQSDDNLRFMNQSIKRFSQPYQEMNNQLQAALNRSNASVGAKLLAAIRGGQQVHGMAEQMYLTGQNQAQQRKDTIVDKITEAGLKEDEYNKQQKELKRAKRNELLKTGISAGFTLLGAGLGSIVPGVGTIAGAGLGSGLGNTLGGLIGLDKNGNLSVQPKDWDTGMMLTGIGEMASSYSSMVNEKNVSKMTNKLSTDLQKAKSSIDNMTLSEYNTFYTQILLAIQRGDTAAYDNLMKPYVSNVAIEQPYNQYGYQYQTPYMIP